MVIQGLRLRASIAGGMGSIPGPGTKILHGAAKKNKQTRNWALESSNPSSATDKQVNLLL